MKLAGCWVALVLAGIASAADFTVDFSKNCGEIRKNLHGCGYMPTIHNQAIFNGNADFQALNFTFSPTIRRSATPVSGWWIRY